MLPELLGTLPGWITAGSMVTFLGLYWKRELGLKKLTIDDKKIEVDESVDIRAHWRDEVKSLREAIHRQSETHRADIKAITERFQDELKASEARHEDCLVDRDALRDEVRALKDEMHGIVRLIAANSADRVLALTGSVGLDLPPEIVDAAKRVEEILDREPPPLSPREPIK